MTLASSERRFWQETYLAAIGKLVELNYSKDSVAAVVNDIAARDEVSGVHVLSEIAARHADAAVEQFASAFGGDEVEET